MKKRISISKPPALRDNSGATMVYVIAVILVMSVLGTAMLNLSSTAVIGQVSANHMDRTWFMAEGGAYYAMPLVENDIRDNGTYDNSTNHNLEVQPFVVDQGGVEEGRFSIQVADNTPGPDFVRITITATIEAEVSTNAQTRLVYELDKTNTPYTIDQVYHTQ